LTDLLKVEIIEIEYYGMLKICKKIEIFENFKMLWDGEIWLV
jgi:hypothetical protein